ncbi:MAG: glycosyltransferase, partial [Phycisphaerae bacterium]|nr:glycosyltransferase [Phycisphaerae bacterium]
MRIGIYASVVASERGHERNVSGHIQVPAQTIRLLRDAGHDVHLISNRFGPDRSLPACMPTDGPMHFVDDGRRRPKTLRGEVSPGGVRPLPLLRQLAQIRSIVRGEGLDVLHVFGYTRSAMLGGVLRTLNLGAPVVVTLVGTTRRPGRAGRWLLGRPDAVITATDAVAA